MKIAAWTMIVVGCVVLAACPPGTGGTPAGGYKMTGNPECPHAWKDSARVPSVATWPTVAIPEYNDCQRFIIEQNGVRHYTKGYFAIFSYPDTASLKARVVPIPGTTLTTGTPVAFIYADSESYDTMHITKGANCLYVYQETTSGDWHAWIAPAVREQGQSVGCARRTDPRQVPPSAELVVHRSSATGLADDDYPNVARWDWDPRNHLQYVGIRCDGAWCDVGERHNFSPSPVHAGWGEGPSHMKRRTVEVKGWYDEQYLANCSPTGACHPTALVGTIFPDSALDTASVNTDYQPVFMRVARIGIDVDPTAPEAVNASTDLKLYESKYDYYRTPPHTLLNQLLMCYGDAAHCIPPGVTVPACGTAPDEVEHGLWWYEVIPGGPNADKLKPKYGCYTKRAPGGGSVHIAGAARWRWVLKDETNWVRCVAGCCQVN